MPKLPQRLNALIANRAAGNFAWLVADRGIRLVVSVFISGWTARYLGLQNFGLLNYALALSAIFAAVAPLGIEGIAVRDIIWNRATAGGVIGTAIGLRTVCAILGALASVVLVTWLRPGDGGALLLVATLGVGMVGQSLEFGELLFRADTRMSVLVVPRLLLFFFLNVIKVALVLRGLSVGWFAALTAFEQVCSGALTAILLRRYAGSSLRLTFDWARGLVLLKECWPLAVSSAFIIVYMRAGQLIIGTLYGDHAIGLYAAAIKIPETANFLPAILGSSLLPGLLARMKAGSDNYDEAVLKYMRISTCLALAICVPLTVGSGLFIRVLFSSAYAEAAPVMAVYSWSLLFIFLGVARNQCLLNEKRTGLTLFLSVVALVSNLALNFILLPALGIMGAAVATVASQLIAGVLSTWLIPSARKLARLQLTALLTPWRVFHSPRLESTPALRPNCDATI